MSDSERENSKLYSTNTREDGTDEPLVDSLNDIHKEKMRIVRKRRTLFLGLMKKTILSIFLEL